MTVFPHDEIVLVTRLRTLNKGNQALSAAWLAVLKATFPGTAIRVIERRPPHLVQHRLRDLASEKNPYAAFDALCTKIARDAPGAMFADPITDAVIELDETIPTPSRFVRLRQRLNLRGLAARLGRYTDAYKRRLAAFQRARLVIVNPAGEFFPREPSAAFYHLLDANVARLLGAPTAIVNHTMDISDPTLRAIIPRMYRELALVGFRDEASVVAFERMGGSTHNVSVTPDLALATEFRGRRGTRPRGKIAVAINVPEANARANLSQWEELIGSLRSTSAIALISNEVPLDRPFYERLKLRFPLLEIAGVGLGHEEYCSLLTEYDVVITSRMHTAILAMIAGTPVVPIEGSSFKISALFRELGLETTVIDPVGHSWPTQVLGEVARVRALGDSATRDMETTISRARHRILESLVPRLQTIASPHARSSEPS